MNEKLISAAIDIGTTYIGFAYSWKHDPIKIHGIRNLMQSDTSFPISTPACILFSEDKKFDSFGYDAEEIYSELSETEEAHGWFFFKRFREALSNKNLPIPRQMNLTAANGKEMTALDVFSGVFKCLRDRLMRYIAMPSFDLQDTDIQWVITVSDDWSDAAKCFIREAATLAGLNQNKLQLVSEGDADIWYCKHLTLNRKEFPAFCKGSKYLVLNCGEDRFAVTAYTVIQDLLLQELYKDSIEIGVDQAFEKLLTEIFGVKVMTDFLYSERAVYFDLRQTFVQEIRTFNGRDKVTIIIPYSLQLTFKSKMGIGIRNSIRQSKFSEQIESWAGRMILEADVCKEFFESLSEQIASNVNVALQIPNMKGTKYIIMVGSFTVSPFLQNMVKRRFPDINVIIPPEPELVTLIGAVISGHKDMDRIVIDKIPCTRVEKFIKIFRKSASKC